MLVVVYLVSVKKNIIIPQEWIMALTQETLNNIGKASYQNRRIFWSNIGVDSGGIPDTSITPNFNRNISLAFPPLSDEACYIARVKYYCATLNRAKYFRDTFRPQLPVLYNPRKKFEVPLPLLPTNDRNTIYPDPLVQREPNDIQIEDEIEPQIEPIAGPSTTHNIVCNENSSVVQEELNVQEFDEISQANLESNGDDEQKYSLPNVELDEMDSLAVSNYFDDEQLDNERANTSTTFLAENETAFLENGVLKIKKIVGNGDDDDDDDYCEMVYTHGERIAPQVDVKLNDLVSMNIPFEENVS